MKDSAEVKKRELPSVACTAAQMTMVEHYMSGWTKERSFRAAFPDRAATSKAVWVEFCKPEVKAEIQRQQELLQEASKTQIKDLTLLWSREKAIQTYMDLITGAHERMQNMAENSRDYAALAKVINDSAAAMSKMLGYDAPIKIDADNKVTVSFDKGDAGEHQDEDSGDDWTG